MKWQLSLLIGKFPVIHGLWAQDPADQIRPGQEGYYPEASKTVFISVSVNHVSPYVIRAGRPETVPALPAGGALRRRFTWSMASEYCKIIPQSLNNRHAEYQNCHRAV